MSEGQAWFKASRLNLRFSRFPPESSVFTVRGVNKLTLPAGFKLNAFNSLRHFVARQAPNRYYARLRILRLPAGLLVLGKDSLDQSFSLQVTHRPVTVQQSVMQARATDVQRTTD